MLTLCILRTPITVPLQQPPFSTLCQARGSGAETTFFLLLLHPDQMRFSTFSQPSPPTSLSTRKGHKRHAASPTPSPSPSPSPTHLNYHLIFPCAAIFLLLIDTKHQHITHRLIMDTSIANLLIIISATTLMLIVLSILIFVFTLSRLSYMSYISVHLQM